MIVVMLITIINDNDGNVDDECADVDNNSNNDKNEDDDNVC